MSMKDNARPPLRRIVTGQGRDGKSRIVSLGPPPHSTELGDGSIYNEIWRTDASVPRLTHDFAETVGPGVVVEPKVGGNYITIADVAPSSLKGYTPESAREFFAGLDGIAVRPEDVAESHPFSHRTRTIDYVIVMSGSVTLGLDTEEVILREGDVVVQLGCNHYWLNHTDTYARLAYVLSSAAFPED